MFEEEEVTDNSSIELESAHLSKHSRNRRKSQRFYAVSVPHFKHVYLHNNYIDYGDMCHNISHAWRLAERNCESSFRPKGLETL